MSLSVGMNFGLGVNLAIAGLSGIKNGQDALTKLSRVMKGTSEQSKKLKSSLTKLNRIDLRMQNAQQQLKDMRSRLAGAIASAGAIAVPVKFAGDLESAMMDFNDAAQMQPKGLAKIADSMRRIGNASGQTQAQIAALGATIKRLGVDNKALSAHMQVAAKMQLALGISADDMKNHLSTLHSAWQLNSAELERFGDGLFMLQNKFSASASKIMATTARTASRTRELGLDAQKAAALTAAMWEVGRGSGQVETAIGDLASGLAGCDEEAFNDGDDGRGCEPRHDFCA